MGIVIDLVDFDTTFAAACGANLVKKQIWNLYAIFSGDDYAMHRGEIHPAAWLADNKSWISRISMEAKEGEITFKGMNNYDSITFTPRNNYAMNVTYRQGSNTYHEMMSITHEFSETMLPRKEIEKRIFSVVMKEYNPKYGEVDKFLGTILYASKERSMKADIDFYIHQCSQLRTLTVLDYVM